MGPVGAGEPVPIQFVNTGSLLYSYILLFPSFERTLRLWLIHLFPLTRLSPARCLTLEERHLDVIDMLCVTRAIVRICGLDEEGRCAWLGCW